MLGFSLPTTLSQVQATQKKEVHSKEEINVEINQVNQTIQVGESTFQQALEMTINLLQNKGNATGSVILQQFPYKLYHNKWQISVPSEVHKQTLEKEREVIIPFMRNLLNVDSLFWEIQIDANLSPKQKILSGGREIFAEIALRNPQVITLEQIFKTRIID